MKTTLQGAKDPVYTLTIAHNIKPAQQQLNLQKLLKPKLKARVPTIKSSKVSKQNQLKEICTNSMKPQKYQQTQLELKQNRISKPKMRLGPSKILDERNGEHNDSISSHRFSDIYKPSKFIGDGNSHDSSMGSDTHLRHKSLMMGRISDIYYPPQSNTSLISKVCITEPTEEYYFPCNKYLSQPHSTKNNASLLVSGEKRKSFIEENRWEFQSDYKNQKSFVKVVKSKVGDDGEVENASGRKKRVSPTHEQEVDFHNSIKKDQPRPSDYVGEDEVRLSTDSNIAKRMELHVFQVPNMSLLEKGFSFTRREYYYDINKENYESNELVDVAKNYGKNPLALKSYRTSDGNFDTQGTESTRLECEETLQLNHHISNTSNTTIMMNALNLNCEESIDGHTYEKKTHKENIEKLSIFSTFRSNESSSRDSLTDDLATWLESISIQQPYSDVLETMMIKDAEYLPDPFYFEHKQSQITWLMRAILIDWMTEVSSEFCLKRDTLYQAINFVDRYLSVKKDIQKWELQLIGVTALFTACKIEEIHPPKALDFAKSTDNGYSTEQIIACEIQMSKSLKWMLTPTTIYNWANFFMKEWDSFIEESKLLIESKLINNPFGEMICFKQPNEQSYTKFREFSQILDLLVLHIDTLQYSSRTIVAGILYLLAGRAFKEFDLHKILEVIPEDTTFLYRDITGFNQIFSEFLKKSFSIELLEILPAIQYVAQYLAVKVCYELPIAAKKSPEIVLSGHYEEFLTFQTHTPSNLQYIKCLVTRRA